MMMWGLVQRHWGWRKMDKFKSYFIGRIKFRLNFKCAEEQEEVVCVLKDPCGYTARNG